MTRYCSRHGPGCWIGDVILEEKDFMINEHGLIVECAYNQLQKNLNNYHTTFDQQKKNEYLFNAFNDFLNNLKK